MGKWHQLNPAMHTKLESTYYNIALQRLVHWSMWSLLKVRQSQPNIRSAKLMYCICGTMYLGRQGWARWKCIIVKSTHQHKSCGHLQAHTELHMASPESSWYLMIARVNVGWCELRKKKSRGHRWKGYVQCGWLLPQMRCIRPRGFWRPRETPKD